MPYTILENIDLQSLLAKTASLPERSSIFFTPVYREYEGEGFTPVLVMKKLHSVSNSPIFSSSDSTLGYVAVGGYLYSPRKLGLMAGEAVISYLNCGKPLNTQNKASGFAYDWNEVTRWGYEDLIDSGSEVLFKKPSPWEQYRNEIIFITVILFLMAILSAALFIFNTRLKRVKKALLNERELLEERVKERTREISLLHEEARKMANIDDLTRLNNRRSFFERGRVIHYDAERYDKSYTIMMLDIDHFKNINDKYGHAAGDKVIKNVAAMIKIGIRKSDVSARIGGEEFAVIMVDTDESIKDLKILNDGQRLLAERLRSKIAGSAIKYEDNFISVKISIGISRYRIGDKSVNATLERADRALYRAKNTGRNRVIFEF